MASGARDFAPRAKLPSSGSSHCSTFRELSQEQEQAHRQRGDAGPVEREAFRRSDWHCLVKREQNALLRPKLINKSTVVQRAHAMPDQCAQSVRLDMPLHDTQRDRFAVGAFHDECKAACSAGLLVTLGIGGLFHDPRDVPQVYRVRWCADEPERYDDEQSPRHQKERRR